MISPTTSPTTSPKISPKLSSASLSRRSFVLVASLLLAAASGSLTAAPAAARQPDVFADLVKGVAVGGYDPVAYFTVGKPVVGLATITHQHAGATWRFATTTNRDVFIAEPIKYAPQYGGYCAWAVSQGYTAKGDPAAWSLVSGKLYLNYNKDVRKGWEQNKAANISKGDSNWPVVLDKKGQ
jgi:hypothetical protein